MRRPNPLFGHQADAVEDGDALLDGREAHRVVAGEFDDAFLGSEIAVLVAMHAIAAAVITRGLTSVRRKRSKGRYYG